MMTTIMIMVTMAIMTMLISADYKHITTKLPQMIAIDDIEC